MTTRTALLSGLLLTAACGNGDALNPVAVNAAAAPPDAGQPDAGEPDSGAVVPKRTIEQRNPFGNVAEAKNLLWDGDFEWTSPFSDQYGWLSGPPLSYAFTATTMGVACRSGLKCASLDKGKVLAGIGVSSKGAKLEASIWAHPSDPSCEGITATLVGLTNDGDPDVDLAPDAAVPDTAGWCRLHAIADERGQKTYFYVKNVTHDVLVVDDAVLKAVPMESAAAGPQPRKLAPPLSPERALELSQLRADLAKLRGPHDPPPNAARRALEKWQKR